MDAEENHAIFEDQDESTALAAAGGASIRTSFLGALRKVHSKIKAEINQETGDEQQRLDDAFEAQWLGEFARLRIEYQTKWDTCTHSADEFCGLLFHSSDGQQQAYLLREYPTLMEAWRDADLSSSALRVRPDWPAARIAQHAVVSYDNLLGSSPTHELASSEPTQRVKTSPSLHHVLSLLRTEFQWSAAAVEAFTLRLEHEQIFSCTELRTMLTKRRGAYAERALQSRAYPRLSRGMLSALRVQAETLERRDESTHDLCMEPLRVNPS